MKCINLLAANSFYSDWSFVQTDLRAPAADFNLQMQNETLAPLKNKNRHNTQNFRKSTTNRWRQESLCEVRFMSKRL